MLLDLPSGIGNVWMHVNSIAPHYIHHWIVWEFCSVYLCDYSTSCIGSRTGSRVLQFISVSEYHQSCLYDNSFSCMLGCKWSGYCILYKIFCQNGLLFYRIHLLTFALCGPLPYYLLFSTQFLSLSLYFHLHSFGTLFVQSQPAVIFWFSFHQIQEVDHC